MRTGMLLLGLGLGVLWLFGLSAGVTPWLVWCDFVVAILSLASVAAPTSIPSLLRGTPFGIGLALVVLWIVGLAMGATSWLTWWTFAFGIAYGLLGIAAGMPETERRGTTTAGPSPV